MIIFQDQQLNNPHSFVIHSLCMIILQNGNSFCKWEMISHENVYLPLFAWCLLRRQYLIKDEFKCDIYLKWEKRSLFSESCCCSKRLARSETGAFDSIHTYYCWSTTSRLRVLKWHICIIVYREYVQFTLKYVRK